MRWSRYHSAFQTGEKNSDLPFELVDLYELAEDIVLHLDSAASKKNINVSLEGNAVTVQGVRHVIYEMLYNIADNAIRYTDQNGTVNIFTGTVNGHAFYRVEDNGIGIPENEQKRIFERFTGSIKAIPCDRWNRPWTFYCKTWSNPS